MKTFAKTVLWVCFLGNPAYLQGQTFFEGKITFATTFSARKSSVIDLSDSNVLYACHRGYLFIETDGPANEQFKRQIVGLLDSNHYLLFAHDSTLLVTKVNTSTNDEIQPSNFVKPSYLKNLKQPKVLNKSGNVPFSGFEPTGKTTVILGYTCREYRSSGAFRDLSFETAYWVAESLLLPFETSVDSTSDSTFVFIYNSLALKNTRNIILGTDTYTEEELRSSTRALTLDFTTSCDNFLSLFESTFSGYTMSNAKHGDFKYHTSRYRVYMLDQVKKNMSNRKQEEK
jgi:hypothetical protein